MRFVVSTTNLITAIGEEATAQILSNFICPLNEDVERFLRCSAILSEKQGFSVTRLVFVPYRDSSVLVGYYTLANKVIVVSKSCNISKTLKRRLNRFGTYNHDLEQREIAAPLIAQLGKNFAFNDQKLITGDELLELATESVRQSLRLLGGRVVYLECEDSPGLINFYERNGFIVFDERNMDKEEQGVMKGTVLKQLIKYFDSKELGSVNQMDEIIKDVVF